MGKHPFCHILLFNTLENIFYLNIRCTGPREGTLRHVRGVKHDKIGKMVNFNENVMIEIGNIALKCCFSTFEN